MKTPVNVESKIITVFGLPIQGGSLTSILAWIYGEAHAAATWIVTTNPEILLEARRNPAYASALKQADYFCVDGFGLWIALRSAGQRVERVTGVSLAEALIKEAAMRDQSVAFLGGAPGVARQAADLWKKTYPALSALAEQGGTINQDGIGDEAEEEAVHRLVLAAPDILLVAFGGGSAKQEAWIARRLADLPSVKVIVGVGGTFDFWTKRLKRAPALLQKIGLEWAWRLVQEPSRWKRILRATIVFPVLFVVDQFKRPGPARKQLIYAFSLFLRVLFFVFILLPAYVVYVRGIAFIGLKNYHWTISDLIIPFVIFCVLYPVIGFLASFVDKPTQVE